MINDTAKFNKVFFLRCQETYCRPFYWAIVSVGRGDRRNVTQIHFVTFSTSLRSTPYFFCPLAAGWRRTQFCDLKLARSNRCQFGHKNAQLCGAPANRPRPYSRTTAGWGASRSAPTLRPPQINAESGTQLKSRTSDDLAWVVVNFAAT